MRKTNKKGFTLVELLLVIAIIGILAAVLFVSLGKQRERARLTTFKENMRGLVTTFTACTDGDGTIGSGDTAGGTASACTNGPSGIGALPEITDCDGDGTVSLTADDPTGDTWGFHADCTTSGGTCTAFCTADGCKYCASGDLAYSEGVFSGTCDDQYCN